MLRSISYTSKVRALISKLLTKRDYELLSEQDSVISIGSYLEKYDYGKIILKYPENLIRMEEELWDLYYQEMERLYNYIPANIPVNERRIFEYFIFKKMEIENLKNILMGIALNLDRDNIFDKTHKKFREKYKEIIYSESLDEAILKLKGEEYFDRLSLGLKYYKERGSMYKLLSELDKYYYENVSKLITHSPHLSKILKTMIDRENLKLIMRYIIENEYKKVPREEFLSLLIPNGRISKFEELIESESVERFIMNITDTPYYDTISKYMKRYKEVGDIDILDKAIDEAYLNVLKNALIRPFGIEIPLCYAEMKRFEVVNLIKIIKLKAENISPDIIKDKIVIIV